MTGRRLTGDRYGLPGQHLIIPKILVGLVKRLTKIFHNIKLDLWVTQEFATIGLLAYKIVYIGNRHHFSRKRNFSVGKKS